MKRQVAIYALINESLQIVYIGASVSPNTRLKYHTCWYGLFRGERLTLRVLRWCDASMACRIELQVVNACKRLGHPLRNSRNSGWKPQRFNRAKITKPRPERKQSIGVIAPFYRRKA